MSDTEYESFEQVVSGASATYPMQCSSLRKNGFVVMKGRPCRIVEMSTSKTGKHGSAKVNLVALDIFTNKKYDEICPSTHNMEVPNVSRLEYTLLNIDGNYLSLMTSTGDTKDDVKLPENELGETIKKEFEDDKELIVTVVSAMGEECAMAYKEAPKS